MVVDNVILTPMNIKTVVSVIIIVFFFLIVILMLLSVKGVYLCVVVWLVVGCHACN